MSAFKKIFTKINLVRAGLLAGLVALVMLTLPRLGGKSFNYEINQPWKYQLLTAEFDFPLYRDTATTARMRDSIDRSFVPFVYRNAGVERESLARFRKLMEGRLTPRQLAFFENELKRVYGRGIIEASLLDTLRSRGHLSLRTVNDGNEGTATAAAFDASRMFTTRLAFMSMDSAISRAGLYPDGAARQEAVKSLDICLRPNVIPDTVANRKFLSQEYFNLAAAQGVIKEGQRIVDIGEIVTPQIYTNLKTYEQLLSEKNDSTGTHYYYYLGQIVFVLVVGGVFYSYLAVNRPGYFGSVRMLTLLMCLMTLFTLAAILLFEHFSYGIYLAPIAGLAVTTLIFTDSRTAVFTLGCTVVLTSLVAPDSFRFFFMELSAGVAAVYCVHTLSRRSQFIMAAGMAFVMYAVTYMASILVQTGNLDTFSWRIIFVLAINCATVSFTYVLVFLIEKIFGFTSAVTLVELSDINNQLLRRLSEEAPGTFQHSIQVSTLAADAARAVGANVQLVRTGALYHDIGKMKSPVFFTENQHGVNPHAGLDPETSAGKIISHVTDGVEMAEKKKIPEAIIDFIREHHGRGITRYFYNTAVNSSPDGNVDIEQFRYPGPNPRSLATTLVMMADSVEAASRSLKSYDEKSIDDLVDSIIDTQMADGLYKDSPISFRDIGIVKQTFKRRLATIYHARVAYPALNRPDPSASARN